MIYLNKAFLVILILSIFIVQSCKPGKKDKKLTSFVYESFRDSLKQHSPDTAALRDSLNVFDGPVFTPGEDSLDTLLMKIDTLLRSDSIQMVKFDSLLKRLKNQKPFTLEEKKGIKENLAAIDSFKLKGTDSTSTSCSKEDCLLYVEVIKSKQILYLYLEGELKDSFLVSTGTKGHETPVMDLRPAGPVFTKYTSRKYPGGNYKGLGNMPYAVFLRGGYAIHGTTTGNFSKLGKKASHGCVRIHPDNALIFSELVKIVGLENTWVTIRETPPDPD